MRSGGFRPLNRPDFLATCCVPDGIRTRVTGLKGRKHRPRFPRWNGSGTLRAATSLRQARVRVSTMGQIKRVGKWEGGYIAQTRGRRVFHVERRRGGEYVHFSTGCSTLAGARAELARWEADPSYRPGAEAAGAVRLDAELVRGYRQHMREQRLSAEWIDEVVRCLADWAEELGGRDLRVLSLQRDLVGTLDRWKVAPPALRRHRGGRVATGARPHHIKAIKGLFRWLRQRGVVERAKDATLDLAVPQARPEKLRRRKVVPPEDVQAVLQQLPQPTRDVLHLLTATAGHLSEVRRFAEGGELAQPLDGQVLAVLVTRQKSGDLTRTPLLYPEHLAAAQRLRQLGGLPKRMTLARHMRAACEAAGVPWFGLGQMRHSVATWARAAGAPVAEVAEFTGHHSPQTLRRFYLDLEHAAPIPIRRLAPEA